MSPLPRPRRAAAGIAATATVLLALAGTGLAATAVTSAVAATDARPDARVAAPAHHAPQATGASVVEAAAPAEVAPAYTSPSSGSTTMCTMTPVPQYTAGQVVQWDTFDTGAAPTNWTTTGTVGMSVSTAAAHRGYAGLRLVDIQNGVTTYRVSNVRSVGTYRLDMSVRLSPDLKQSTTYPYVMVYVQDETTGAVLATSSPRLSTEWVSVSVPVVPRSREGMCGSGVWGAPMLVTFRVMTPGCGTMPEISLDVDDVTVTYAGTSTESPSATAARVVPACQPPTTTTGPTTTLPTTTLPTTSSTPPTTSTTPPTSTAPPAKATCKVKATPVMTWKGGVQLQVTVANLSAAPWAGWTLTAKLPTGETAAYAWPGAVSQSSGQLSLAPASGYADPLAPRTPVKFGLVLSGGTALPTAWAVNGVSCKG